ncbi:hypothetical protein A8990_10937 [Paenibacillus taihuensis]|uniref:Uncharacterized protein n=1 Tax=Paenibacillus taihuensis TaxID=1156355 RepID=A0A3D9S409_9BACL|nr:hypothetical protein A8990_10937 [Paenibacillus taihuensis]
MRCYFTHAAKEAQTVDDQTIYAFQERWQRQWKQR